MRIATWCTIPSLISVEAILFGSENINTIILDNEHGSFSYDMVRAIATMVQLHDRQIMVRIPKFDEVQLLKYYEMDVPVLVSHVEDARTAKDIHYAINYPPIGHRGFSPYTSCHRLLMNNSAAQSMKFNNETCGKINIMLEGESLVDDDTFDGILKLRNKIDLIYIGIYDLSNWLGYDGNVKHPTVLSLLKRRVKAINDAGIMSGTHATTKSDIYKFAKMGFTFIAHENDAHMLASAYRDKLSKHVVA